MRLHSLLPRSRADASAVVSARAACGASQGSSGPLVLRSLMKCAVDPVTQDVGGVVGERLVQVAQDDADQQVHLARPGSQALDRWGGQLPAGGRKAVERPDLRFVRFWAVTGAVAAAR